MISYITAQSNDLDEINRVLKFIQQNHQATVNTVNQLNTSFIQSSSANYNAGTATANGQLITLTGDVSGSSLSPVTTLVSGIMSHAIPALAPGNLNWTGTAWNFTSGGTVTTVSVVSANGFAGSVANPTSTPAITLTTSISGLIKGVSGALTLAAAGTDYEAALGNPATNGFILSSTSAGVRSWIAPFNPTAPGPIGGTTPGTGSFTTGLFSGSLRQFGTTLARIESTGGAVPSGSTGVGAEIYTTGGAAYFQAYNRTTPGFVNAVVNGSTVIFQCATVTYATVSTTGLAVTGYVDATLGFRASEAANAKQGVATLALGTVTVANTSVTATSRIFLTRQGINASTAMGELAVSARTAGTSFTITSYTPAAVTTLVTDLSTVAWEIFEVG